MFVGLPQGFGKTGSTFKALIENGKIIFVYLGPSHDFLDDQNNNPFLKNLGIHRIPHIKGMQQLNSLGKPLCSNQKMIQIQRCNLDSSILCEKCNDKNECQFKEQFKEIREVKSWRGVHKHLPTKIVQEYECHCIIVDENPLPNLVDTLEIKEEQLVKNQKVLQEIQEQTKSVKIKNICSILLTSIDASIRLKDVTEHDTIHKEVYEKKKFIGLLGLSFVNHFIINTGWDKKKQQRISELLKKKDKHLTVLKKKYIDSIINLVWDNDESKHVLNIIDELVEIIQTCLHYSLNPPPHDINLSFYSETEKHRLKKGGFDYVTKVVKRDVNIELPKIPLIILDATGDKEYYSKLLGREIIEYKIPVEFPIDRNIIQITDGRYFAQSLIHEHTRNKVYKAVRFLVQHHKSLTNSDINIVTMKRYSRITDEDEPYNGMSIQRYMQDHGHKDDIKYYHYGNIRGKNQMQDSDVIILIGTYEPNHFALVKEAACWHIGEPSLSNKRKKDIDPKKYTGDEGYEYVDERYSLHVRQKREAEIEHALERIRFALTPGKSAYFFSSLPIRFDTVKMNIDEMLQTVVIGKKFPNAFIDIFKRLAKGRGMASFTTLDQSVRNHKAIINYGGTQAVLDDMVKYRLIERNGNYSYRFTDKGKEYYKKIKMISDFKKGKL